MKAVIFILFFIYSLSSIAQISLPRAATGFEAGVANVSGDNSSLIGTSWVYHFEFQPDTLLSFFGQAGSSRAEDEKKKLKQTAFAGGIQFDLLPLEFRLGVATTVAEIDKDDKHIKKNEMGPMAAVTVSIPIRVFKIGASATVIRTSTINTTALRVLGLIVF